MSDRYTLVREGLDQWINSPNNSGECCQTTAETVNEMNRLLDQIKRLEDAGNAMESVLSVASGSNSYIEWMQDAMSDWRKAKEAKL